MTILPRRWPRLTAWLLAGLMALALGACTLETKDGAKQEKGGKTLDLSRLIVFNTFIRNSSGRENRQIQLFYDRESGRHVTVSDLVLGFGNGATAMQFSEGLAVASRQEHGPCGYIDAVGRVVIPFQYDYAAPFSDGLAWVEVHGQEGIIDTAGRWIVPPGKYEKLGTFHEGRCAFLAHGLWGFLGRDGSVAVPPTWGRPVESVPQYHNGLCLFGDDAGRHFFVDQAGHVKIALPARIMIADSFAEGRARIVDSFDGSGAKMLDGYIDTNGVVVIAPVYKSAGDFSEGLAQVSMNAEELPETADRDLVAFDRNDRWGFIDTTGKVVIPFDFQRAGQFSGGVARVLQDGHWGYVNKAGQLVIPPQFEWVGDFCDGIAEVWLKGAEGPEIAFIDLQGRVIVRTGVRGEMF